MRLVAIAVGVLAQAVAWRAVAKGRASVWTLMSPVLAACGVLAVLVRPPVASGTVGVVPATLAGLALGVALYFGTLAFVAVASGVPVFRRHVEHEYQGLTRSRLPAVLAMALLLAVPGEELFWRGLVQPRLRWSMPTLSGPALAWLGYVAVNVASGSLAFIAGAVVGGIVWGGLALWTHGVLASLVCHLAWNVLMLLRPPAPAREMMGT